MSSKGSIEIGERQVAVVLFALSFAALSYFQNAQQKKFSYGT